MLLPAHRGDSGEPWTKPRAAKFLRLAQGRSYASEMEDNAERDARAIDGLARVTQTDVVDLRTQSDVRNHTNVDTAAKTKRKLIGSGRSASIRSAKPGATHETLHERIDVGGVAERQARTEQERVGVKRNAGGCGMINAKITNDAQP